jgi:hypothetical protein
MKKASLVSVSVLFTLMLSAQTMLLPVPYHSQGSPWFSPDSGYPAPPNNWCTVACLHMLFDYYDHMGNEASPFPAQQIAAVCNTDDAAGVTGGHLGTYASDAVRAAHFSMISNSADGSSVTGGYSWRKIGYSVVYGDTTGPPPYLQDFLNPGTANLVGWMEVLNEGYPVIFSGYLPWTEGPPEGAPGADLPNETEIGHSILLVGYSFVPANPLQSLLYFHDPWYGPYVTYTVNQLLTNPVVIYVFAAPWEVKINAPYTLIKDSSFTLSTSVRYTAPTVEYVYPNGPAFQQQFPVIEYPVALFHTDSCSLPVELDSAGPEKTLRMIDLTQSSYAVNWSAIPRTSGINGSFSVKAVGLLQDIHSNSYPGYQDTIGGIVTGGCAYVTEEGAGVGTQQFNIYRTRLYPNPFIQTNSITLSLPEAGKVKIIIYDELGREIKVLKDASLSSGQHVIPWDGTDKKGKLMPAGKYFYNIQVDGKNLPGEKAILLK